MNELLAGIRERLEGDRVLWGIALVLTVASLVTVYSAISTLAYKADGNSAKFLFKQIGLLTGGWVVMFGVHRIHFKYFGKLANALFVLAIAALVFTLLFGTDINDARRWIKIPFIGLTVQTSDFAKLALVLWVARQLQVRANVLHDVWQGLMPILGGIGIVCLLILPSDFSTAAMLGAICVTMLFVGGLPWSHMFRIGALALVGLVSLYGIGKAAPEALPRFGTWANRMESFVGFATGEEGGASSAEDYQIELAQVAIHKGGLFPHGPASGTSRNFLPHPYSDMIFAFIVEEWGAIIGGLGLVLLYLALLFRASRTAIKCESAFGRNLVLGLGLMITVQALVNMGVSVRLFPTTGQPLPLVSYGGTSLLFTCLSLGIMLAVSRVAQQDDSGSSRASGPNSLT
ncbi:MAG: FtsW/RodA/SpoVE family cell cycle protein [Bacteroidota bacterium]|nr:FtsW/RodA/SpoVE family cell cycle protein [Bacteroidota bacterium]